MPREWLFNARFAGWRSRWANAEPRRLLVQATEAFIDRALIDWATLLGRARGDRDRAIVQNLCFLDSIREAAGRARSTNARQASGRREARPAPERRSPTSLLVRLVVVLATTQVICSLVVLATALASGESISNRAPQVVLTLGFAAASLFLGTVTSRDPRSLYLLAFFVCAASAFARGALTGLREGWAESIDPVTQGLFPETFIPGCMWLFALDFPRVRRFTVFDMLTRHGAAATCFLGSLVFGINVVAAYHPVDQGLLVYLLRDHPSNAFWHLLAATLVPAVAVVLVRSHRAPPSERRKVARFACAITAGTTPFLLFGVAPIVWPGVGAWLLVVSPFQRIWLVRLVITALAVTPILATAAVIVDRPLELQSILRRAWRYALARSALTALVAAPFVVLFLALYGLRDVVIADLFADSRAWLLLSCAAVGCLLLFARSTLLETVDRRFSRRAADHRELLARSLERVRNARGQREIMVTVKRELCKSIGAAAVHLLVPKGGDAFAEPFGGNTQLPRDAAIVAMLQKSTTPLDLSGGGPLFALLPKEERDWVAANDVELAAALTRRDGTVAAIALVGHRVGGLPFDERDRWFVTTLTTAAAAVWDSARSTSRAGEAAGHASGRGEAALECPRCGVVVDTGPLPCSCRVDASLASLPRRLRGKFIVQRRLGAGGMGVVYLARDTTLDREVALKTLPELGEGGVSHLREEARAMATLNHASLATIYDLEIWRHTPVLVVEYLPNGTLAHRLTGGPLSPASAVRVGLTLTRALTYVHSKGLLHRDLKPSNIGFAATGAPKLLDFGLATLIPPSTDVDRQRGASAPIAARAPFAGTPAYLPPEAYEGAPPTTAFDLWALSVVMLEAMTGVNPFATADRVRLSHRGRNSHSADLSAYLSDLPPALGPFFERALARRPESRFHTSSEMHSALEAAASSPSFS
ncbi:MAG: protein kinase [Luteitalea sp.]|nr:protein kinase [Luteitalea sp.]